MKRYNINWSIKTLVNQMAKGNLDFDNSVQRSLVWDLDKKSLLIHSALYGYGIPALHFTKEEDGTYSSLDGKQRSNAFSEYLNGNFALKLSVRDYVEDDDDKKYNFDGMKFDELPEWAQDRIKDYSLTIYYYEDMTDSEIHEFFRRLNNGKPLSSVELTRVKAASIVSFQKLAKTEAVQAVVTDKGRARFNDENIAMQCYAMVYMPEPDFGTKVFRPWITEVIVRDDQLEALNAALSKVYRCIETINTDAESKESKRVLRKLKSRTHFVSTVYLAYLCADMSDSDFCDLVWSFFNCTTTTTSNEYNNSIGAGSAKPQAIEARKRAIETLAASAK